MQNRYVGDIGDYVKLCILRALLPAYRLGVAWWLYFDEDHNKDGRHIGYLRDPAQWRLFDPTLFDALSEIVTSGPREMQRFRRRSCEARDQIDPPNPQIGICPAHRHTVGYRSLALWSLSNSPHTATVPGDQAAVTVPVDGPERRRGAYDRRHCAPADRL
jgi:hypothetical protein